VEPKRERTESRKGAKKKRKFDCRDRQRRKERGKRLLGSPVTEKNLARTSVRSAALARGASKEGVKGKERPDRFLGGGKAAQVGALLGGITTTPQSGGRAWEGGKGRQPKEGSGSSGI